MLAHLPRWTLTVRPDRQPAGIACFTGLAFLDAPPLVWFRDHPTLFVGVLGKPGFSVSITWWCPATDARLPVRHDKVRSGRRTTG